MSPLKYRASAGFSATLTIPSGLDGVASGLGGVPLADLPDLCGPVVDLMATGYLWVRGNGWAWSGWPPVLAALQVG
jgi:hypothetical protein